MANLPAFDYQTLIDFHKEMGPGSFEARVVDVISRENVFMQHASWAEANEGMSYKIQQTLNNPEGQWRRINEGVLPEAAHNAPLTESAGMLETYSQIDEALVDNLPRAKGVAKRVENAGRFIRGMSWTAEKAIVYGDMTGNPASITGLEPRLRDPDNPLIFDAGGTAAGDPETQLTSIYVVMWGPDQTTLFHPLDHPTKGVTHQAMGKMLVDDIMDPGNRRKFNAWVDYFKFHFGLAVLDMRTIGRIANIRVDAEEGDPGYFDENMLIRLTNRMPRGRKFIYVPTEILSTMQIKLKDKMNVYYTDGGGDGLSGGPIVRFNGIDVYDSKAIREDEAHVAL